MLSKNPTLVVRFLCQRVRTFYRTVKEKVTEIRLSVVNLQVLGQLTTSTMEERALDTSYIHCMRKSWKSFKIAFLHSHASSLHQSNNNLCLIFPWKGSESKWYFHPLLPLWTSPFVEMSKCPSL